MQGLDQPSPRNGQHILIQHLPKCVTRGCTHWAKQPILQVYLNNGIAATGTMAMAPRRVSLVISKRSTARAAPWRRKQPLMNSWCDAARDIMRSASCPRVDTRGFTPAVQVWGRRAPKLWIQQAKSWWNPYPHLWWISQGKPMLLEIGCKAWVVLFGLQSMPFLGSKHKNRTRRRNLRNRIPSNERSYSLKSRRITDYRVMLPYYDSRNDSLPNRTSLIPYYHAR